MSWPGIGPSRLRARRSVSLDGRVAQGHDNPGHARRLRARAPSLKFYTFSADLRRRLCCEKRYALEIAPDKRFSIFLVFFCKVPDKPPAGRRRVVAFLGVKSAKRVVSGRPAYFDFNATTAIV
jgi:hypothetical protein